MWRTSWRYARRATDRTSEAELRYRELRRLLERCRELDAAGAGASRFLDGIAEIAVELCGADRSLTVLREADGLAIRGMCGARGGDEWRPIVQECLHAQTSMFLLRQG